MDLDKYNRKNEACRLMIRTLQIRVFSCSCSGKYVTFHKPDTFLTLMKSS